MVPITVLLKHQEVDLEPVVEVVYYPHAGRGRIWDVEISYALCLTDEPLFQVICLAERALEQNLHGGGMLCNNVGRLRCLRDTRLGVPVNREKQMLDAKDLSSMETTV